MPQTLEESMAQLGFTLEGGAFKHDTVPDLCVSLADAQGQATDPGAWDAFVKDMQVQIAAAEDTAETEIVDLEEPQADPAAPARTEPDAADPETFVHPSQRPAAEPEEPEKPFDADERIRIMKSLGWTVVNEHVMRHDDTQKTLAVVVVRNYNGTRDEWGDFLSNFVS